MRMGDGQIIGHSHTPRVKHRLRHGHARNGHKTVLYRAWQRLHDRCFNVNSHRFHRYGGRGITVKIMHNDFGNRTKREEFRYHYKGSELLPYAERAYLRYLKAEIRGISANIAQKFPEVKQRFALILYRDEGDEFLLYLSSWGDWGELAFDLVEPAR